MDFCCDVKHFLMRAHSKIIQNKIKLKMHFGEQKNEQANNLETTTGK